MRGPRLWTAAPAFQLLSAAELPHAAQCLHPLRQLRPQQLVACNELLRGDELDGGAQTPTRFNEMEAGVGGHGDLFDGRHLFTGFRELPHSHQPVAIPSCASGTGECYGISDTPAHLQLLSPQVVD